jgi:uncharacterized OB-fold protein
VTLPAPPISPSPDAAPFWEAARRHELLLPYCEAGDGFFFYPRTACPACGSRDVGWRRASGRGRIHSFTIQPASRVPGYEDAGPFVSVLVELEEGPRLLSLLVGVEPDPEHVRCDLPVEVAFLDQPGGASLPVFRLAADA